MDLQIEKTISTVPLIRLKIFPQNEVYIMLEKFNITGSIKVKTVYRILKNAIEKWLLDKSKEILEASSWNTAIALAYFGNIFDVKVKIILPKSTASCKKKLINSFGAEIIEIEWITDDCIRYRDELYLQNKDQYFLPDQFKNYDNLRAHYHLTGKYIYEKLWKIDFFCAGLGTSGTLLGTGLYLKEQNPSTKIIWVNPIEKVEWLRDFTTSKTDIPFFKEYKYLIDEQINIDFKDAIFGVDAYLQEGYFVGLSSWAALSWLEKFLANKTWLKGVILAPDGWDYYFETLIKYIDLRKYRGCQ